MKNIILRSISLLFIFISLHTNAQTILTEDFETVTIPHLPGGWLKSGSGTPAWKTGSGSISSWSVAGGYALPYHTQYAIIDQWNDSTQNYLNDTLISPIFNLTGYTTVYLNYDYFFYNATISGNTEKVTILGSIDSGATWSIIDSLPGSAAIGGFWATNHTNLSVLSGSNCKIAFTYTNGNGHLLGATLDNIVIENISNNAAAITNIIYNNSTEGIATNGTPLGFTVRNDGNTITNLNVKYQINSHLPINQNFTSIHIAPYTSQTFTFSSPITGAIAGMDTIIVTATMVNSVINSGISDSTMTTNFVLADSSVQRNVLIEEFASSSSLPANNFSSSFDPLTTFLNANTSYAHFNIIKYEMNFPGWGDDRSYNLSASERKTYYNCINIPQIYLNGNLDIYRWNTPFNTTDSNHYLTAIDSSKNSGAFMSMSGIYFIDTIHHKIDINISTLPTFTKTGNYHLYVALCDKHYKNYDNEYGMTDYYNVMRMMLPNGNGSFVSSWSSGSAYNYHDSNINYNYYNSNSCTSISDTSGLYPYQMSNDFWSNPLFGSKLVAWIQDDDYQEVLQSIVIPASSSPDGSSFVISTLSNVSGINLFPNPVKQSTHLQFNLSESSNVLIRILTYNGKIISEIANREMGVGNQKININTENIPSGNYLVSIITKGGMNVEPISVIH